ncbi:adenosylcobinamide-GDP ribazoletransferase [Nocardioides insulae]|uniref:adenosylcobinamide-GDP ribazoletransferase n=1 Tax=Nocardioides insulae TaxID=394734 RepID=UPI0005679019|nr:adenosylcobinamide-GDP ribazoletransferase [Nocardioides insulae]
MRDGVLLAAGTLTAVPVPAPRTVDRAAARVAMLIAPLAVLPLGVAVAAVLAAGGLLGLPAPVIGLLAVGALALGSRAFHLDGLSDTVDGLTASYDRERSLAVMKTGTAGPAGVVALVVVLGLQAAALGSLSTAGSTPLAGALLAGVAVLVSRCSLALCCARGIPSARPGGLGDLYSGSVPRTGVLVSWAVAAAVLAALAPVAGLPWWRGLLAMLLAAAVVGLLIRHTTRRLGGVTGDVFGASVELSLATILLALT